MIEPALARPGKSSNMFVSMGPDRQATLSGRLYPTLHLLRLLAALSIFTGHWSEPFFAQLWPQGQIAIDVFFMIEGFLAMRLLGDSFERVPVGKLILDRFVHVYPLYVVGLLAGFVAFVPLAAAHEQGWTVAKWTAAFASGAMLLPTFSTLVHGSVFPLNPPTWAIILELMGFALLAAGRYRSSRATLVFIWAGAIGTFAILAVAWHDPNPGWATTHYWGGLPRMAFGFFGGAILCLFHARIDSVIPKPSPIWVCAAFVAMHFPAIRFIGWPLLAFGVPVVVALAASSRRPEWSQSAGAWAARNALTVYLLGYPVMMIWREATAGHPPPTSLAGILLDYIAVTGTLLLVSAAITSIYLKMFGTHDDFEPIIYAEG